MQLRAVPRADAAPRRGSTRDGAASGQRPGRAKARAQAQRPARTPRARRHHQGARADALQQDRRGQTTGRDLPGVALRIQKLGIE